MFLGAPIRIFSINPEESVIEAPTVNLSEQNSSRRMIGLNDVTAVHKWRL